MDRTTEQHLQAVVDRINRMTGSAQTPYIGNVAQIGCYHLSHAYGGVALHRMHNESGGVSDVLGCGHVTKRDLADRLYAFIKGIETGCDMMAATEAA